MLRVHISLVSRFGGPLSSLSLSIMLGVKVVERGVVSVFDTFNTISDSNAIEMPKPFDHRQPCPEICLQKWQIGGSTALTRSSPSQPWLFRRHDNLVSSSVTFIDNEIITCSFKPADWIDTRLHVQTLSLRPILPVSSCRCQIYFVTMFYVQIPNLTNTNTKVVTVYDPLKI